MSHPSLPGTERETVLHMDITSTQCSAIFLCLLFLKNNQVKIIRMLMFYFQLAFSVPIHYEPGVHEFLCEM